MINNINNFKTKIDNIYYNFNIKTHMPFIFNENIILCCFGFNNLMHDYNYYWKVGYIDIEKNEDYFLIDTKFLINSTNCSPFLYKENEKYVFSCLSNTLYNNFFEMSIFEGYNLDNLYNTEIIENTAVGFKFKNYYLVSYVNGAQSLLINNNQILVINNKCKILRLNNSNYGLTFTLDHLNYGLFEILLDKNNQIKIIKIKNSNISPYKCHLQNDVLAYAKKGDSFEDRIIDFTHHFYFENIPEEIMKDIYIVNDWSSYI